MIIGTKSSDPKIIVLNYVKDEIQELYRVIKTIISCRIVLNDLIESFMSQGMRDSTSCLRNRKSTITESDHPGYSVVEISFSDSIKYSSLDRGFEILSIPLDRRSVICHN